MEIAELEPLLEGAAERLESIEIEISITRDQRLCQRAAYWIPQHLPVPPDEVVDEQWTSSWHLWASRPCSHVVTERRGTFFEFRKGSTPRIAWHDGEIDGVREPVESHPPWDARPCQSMLEGLDAELEERLNPAVLIEILYTTETTYSAIVSEDRVLDRECWFIDLTYAQVDPYAWSESFPPSDRSTVWIDKEFGILLRTGAWFEGEEYERVDTTFLSFDPIDPSVFEPPD